jgi:hypothetical protein
VNFTSGFTSAVNELAFGSNHSFGDACGRCFQITPTADPFNSSFQGPFGNTIIVKVNNLCLNNNASQHNWCGQTVSHPKNEFNVSMQCVLTFSIRTWSADIKTNRSFDLCDLSGSSQAFFPTGRLAMIGDYQEVSCTLWKGSAGTPLWNGSCVADENAAFWPTPACGNEGMKRSPAP